MTYALIYTNRVSKAHYFLGSFPTLIAAKQALTDEIDRYSDDPDWKTEVSGSGKSARLFDTLQPEGEHWHGLWEILHH